MADAILQNLRAQKQELERKKREIEEKYEAKKRSAEGRRKNDEFIAVKATLANLQISVTTASHAVTSASFTCRHIENPQQPNRKYRRRQQKEKAAADAKEKAEEKVVDKVALLADAKSNLQKAQSAEAEAKRSYETEKKKYDELFAESFEYYEGEITTITTQIAGIIIQITNSEEKSKEFTPGISDSAVRDAQKLLADREAETKRKNDEVEKERRELEALKKDVEEKAKKLAELEEEGDEEWTNQAAREKPDLLVKRDKSLFEQDIRSGGTQVLFYPSGQSSSDCLQRLNTLRDKIKKGKKLNADEEGYKLLRYAFIYSTKTSQWIMLALDGNEWDYKYYYSDALSMKDGNDIWTKVNPVQNDLASLNYSVDKNAFKRL